MKKTGYTLYQIIASLMAILSLGIVILPSYNKRKNAPKLPSFQESIMTSLSSLASSIQYAKHQTPGSNQESNC